MKRLIPTVFMAGAVASALIVSSAMAESTQGWKVRVDRSTSASDPDGAGAVKFTAEPKGFHAVNPQAAVYWNPANTASGNYTIKGTFILLEPSNHTNYYGIVFGGKNLDGADQTYDYFTVAQDGTWLLKRREGGNARTIVAKTPASAVKTPGADGKSVNNLEVRVAADKVDFVVNGTVVHSEQKSALGDTNGIWGARVNHFMNVEIDGLSASK